MQTICRISKKSCKGSGLKLKQEKCKFSKPSLVYLGHEISAAELQPAKKNTKAIIEAIEPRDVGEPRSYIGLLSNYGKFLPIMSTLLAPLCVLLQKNTHWRWTDRERDAFNESMLAIMEANYDPSKKLVMPHPTVWVQCCCIGKMGWNRNQHSLLAPSRQQNEAIHSWKVKLVP